MKLGFREAVGIKIAVAILRDLIARSRHRCVDTDRLLWLLDEVEAYADHVIRMSIGVEALEMGRYIDPEVLDTEKALQVEVARA